MGVVIVNLDDEGYPIFFYVEAILKNQQIHGRNIKFAKLQDGNEIVGTTNFKEN